jgi:tRNA(Glu) U13 pseudouridine synthase TruD
MLILIYSFSFFLWKVSFSKDGKTLSNTPNYNDAILKSLPEDIMKEKSNFYENVEFIGRALRKLFEAAIASIDSNEIKSSGYKRGRRPLTSTQPSNF